ncbi:O-antigen ligase family protein [Winogradskyella aurantiaca]|uniref:O-antigen ligase family protein n=1 Tax=Winogradskyella aurantiaca TaxID=2219558 RepID=UPI001300427F|nr:O-antigen ligase family protein [Winogradskyella aurantiaca]
MLLLYRKKISIYYGFVCLIIFAAILFSSCRSALFISILTFIVFYFLTILNHFKNKLWIRVCVDIFFGIVVFMGLMYLNREERLSVKNFEIESIDFSKKRIDSIIVFSDNPFTESLSLRLNHYQTSINMIAENPFFGVGPGRWNKTKGDYGSKDKNLMDSHNDFLALASQYGLPAGVYLFYLIFILPFKLFKGKGSGHNIFINYLLIVNIVMIFAGITNAGIFKHQVYAFLLFICMINLFNKNY